MVPGYEDQQPSRRRRDGDKADPKSDVELFVVCPVCGQIFDCRDEVQVRHHAEALHEPLLT